MAKQFFHDMAEGAVFKDPHGHWVAYKIGDSAADVEVSDEGCYASVPESRRFRRALGGTGMTYDVLGKLGDPISPENLLIGLLSEDQVFSVEGVPQYRYVPAPSGNCCAHSVAVVNGVFEAVPSQGMTFFSQFKTHRLVLVGKIGQSPP